ncbi:MAG: D-hexose-6-phosphate mutarotase [Dermatophilus congolensis]|nr:D-hexose-6-phosphate mutarotase [Dermatophilus congolensis]
MADIDTSSLPAGVTLVEGNGGLPALRVSTASCEGEVYLLGAHVTAWTPTGAEPVLWMSEKSEFVAGKAIRGGVPICGPWFGPGKKGGLSPAHGWFRINEWKLASASAQGDDVTLVFTLDGADAEVPEGASRGVRAEYTVTFGSELGLSLTVTSDDALELEEALHTYLAVSDINDVTVEGLGGTRYVDKAPGGRAVNAQQGDLKFLRETDRVYAHDGSATVVDPGKGRRITVQKEGSGSTVVWNPWTAKAAAMADFGDDEWPGMVCLEVANALAKAVALEAGGSHTMKATYSVSAL